MTFVVKSASKDIISLPKRLMDQLSLIDGEEVKPVIEGQTLRLARLEKFLALRGALADDDEFDEAVDYLQKAWNEWTPSDIA